MNFTYIFKKLQMSVTPGWGAPGLDQVTKGDILQRYNMKTTKKMAYKKPQLIAKNNPTGSFAAGCPVNERFYNCMNCERTE